MPVPNSFANVTTSIPLSQLDANFNTPITLGNTAIQLGNTVTTLNNMTLANVTISSGNVTITNVSVTTANVATANVTTSQILNYGTANQVQYLNASKALTGSANLTFDGTTFTHTGASNFATSTGNVGIGTSSPGYTASGRTVLQVNGSSQSIISLAYGGTNAWYAYADSSNTILYSEGSRNLTVGTVGAGNYVFATNNAEKMRLDSSGNLGLGVTPSAWGGGVFKVLQLGGGGSNLSAASGTDEQIQVVSNAYYDGSAYRYVISTHASRYVQNNSVHQWDTAASGTAGNAITFTQAMTLHASGGLSVGSTGDPAVAGRIVCDSLRCQNASVISAFGPVSTTETRIESYTGANTGIVTFWAGGSERASINASGVFTCAGIYNNTVGATNRDVFVDNTGKVGYVASIRASKINIQDLTDTSWLHQLNPVSFNYRKKDEEGGYTDEIDGDIQYGLIAEDAEQVRPDLCFYDEVDGEQELRGIQYSKLVPVMLKEIQKLRAELNALKGNA